MLLETGSAVPNHKDACSKATAYADHGGARVKTFDCLPGLQTRAAENVYSRGMQTISPTTEAHAKAHYRSLYAPEHLLLSDTQMK